MRKPDIIMIDGHAFSWRRIVRLRRQQIEEWKAAQAEQPALFELKDDRRPKAESTAEGRYREPGLFARIDDPAA